MSLQALSLFEIWSKAQPSPTHTTPQQKVGGEGWGVHYAYRGQQKKM